MFDIREAIDEVVKLEQANADSKNIRMETVVNN